MKKVLLVFLMCCATGLYAQDEQSRELFLTSDYREGIAIAIDSGAREMIKPYYLVDKDMKIVSTKDKWNSRYRYLERTPDGNYAYGSGQDVDGYSEDLNWTYGLMDKNEKDIWDKPYEYLKYATKDIFIYSLGTVYWERKVGLMNSKQEVLKAEEFVEITFKEGLFFCKINDDSLLVLNEKLEPFKAGYYQFFEVHQNPIQFTYRTLAGKSGLLDKEGNLLIEEQYDFILPIGDWQKERKYYLAKDYPNEVQKDRAGIYDRMEKKWIIEPTTDLIYVTSEKDYAVLNKSGNMLLFNCSSGEQKEFPQYTVSTEAGNFDGKFSLVAYDKNARKYGTVDLDGNVVIPCVYNFSFYFQRDYSTGKAQAKVYYKDGFIYINPKGEELDKDGNPMPMTYTASVEEAIFKGTAQDLNAWLVRGKVKEQAYKAKYGDLVSDAVSTGDTAKMDLLFQAGFKPNFFNYDQNYSFIKGLMEVKEEKQEAVTDFWLKRGLKPHIKPTGLGQTLFNEACYRGKVGIVKALVKVTDVNDTGGYSKDTPLHQAVRGYFDSTKEVMKILLEAGADQKLKNREGKTPLQLAKKQKDKEKAAILKAYKKRA
jgi:hypothetical protein